MVGLETEHKVFKSLLQEWLSTGREGQWVAIQRDHILSFFPSLNEAYEAGVHEWGTDRDFLVKEIRSDTEVATIQRVFWSPRNEQKEAG